MPSNAKKVKQLTMQYCITVAVILQSNWSCEESMSLVLLAKIKLYWIECDSSKKQYEYVGDKQRHFFTGVNQTF